MGRPGKRARPEPDGLGAGERWMVARRDGAVALCIAGPPGRRVKIADFGIAVNGVAWERADFAAQAPRMYEALLDLISSAREAGSIVEQDGRPRGDNHGPGCGCGICDGLVALAFAEGSSRCIVCGCTQDDACIGALGEGCAWADREHLICTAHPRDVIRRAQRFLAGPHRKENRT
ncbi:MAG TPA: hypothetical protein VLS49_13445 [Usitatibacter sp.]|nr:hypothetical protein [Usitatibacter sp.]